MEIWKKIYGFENYSVSNFGNVKNIRKNKLLKGCKDKDGYIISVFYNSHGRKTLKFHRLVALAFIPNPDNKPQVNHKDGNKSNNNVDNLEWATAKENQIHAVNNGLNNPTTGERCSFYGLKGVLNIKSKKVINIITNEKFNSIKEASDFYGIKYTILSKNLNGSNKNKTNLRYHYPCIVGVTTLP